MPVLTLASIKQALFPTDYSILDKVPRIHYSTFASTLRSAGSPAYPEASECWTALRKYGVDPALALAQFQHESSYGTAGRAVVNKSWGNIKRDTFVVYKDWASGAEDYAALVSGYLYAGNSSYNTARKMPYRYAPSADGNNPAEYGAALVKSIGLLIKQDKINNPPATIPTTGGTVSTDRATTLADAIKTRVQYIMNRVNSGNIDPRSYTEDVTAINTYVDELHALMGNTPQPDTTTNTPTTPVVANVPETTPVIAPTPIEPVPGADQVVEVSTPYGIIYKWPDQPLVGDFSPDGLFYGVPIGAPSGTVSVEDTNRMYANIVAYANTLPADTPNANKMLGLGFSPDAPESRMTISEYLLKTMNQIWGQPWHG